MCNGRLLRDLEAIASTYVSDYGVPPDAAARPSTGLLRGTSGETASGVAVPEEKDASGAPPPPPPPPPPLLSGKLRVLARLLAAVHARATTPPTAASAATTTAATTAATPSRASSPPNEYHERVVIVSQFSTALDAIERLPARAAIFLNIHPLGSAVGSSSSLFQRRPSADRSMTTLDDNTHT